MKIIRLITFPGASARKETKIVTYLIFFISFQAMQEVLKLNSSGDLTVEWLLEKDLPGIIIHDKLMTDAALGTRPIKTEHSYSLSSDGDSLPDSPISNNKMDGM